MQLLLLILLFLHMQQRSQDQQLDGQSEFRVQNLFCSVSHRSRLQCFTHPTRIRKTKEREQRWPSFHQTNSFSPSNKLQHTTSGFVYRAQYTSHPSLIRHFEYILSWWNIYTGAEGTEWNAGVCISSLYPHFMSERFWGVFSEGRLSSSAHLRQAIYNRCPRVLSAAALQPADTTGGRLRYFLIPSAPCEPRQQNSSCAFEVSVCWCDVSSVFVF